MKVEEGPMNTRATAGAEASVGLIQGIVKITRQEHTRLVWEAKYWQAQHRRAANRVELLRLELQQVKAQAREREAALRDSLAQAEAQIRDLKKRLFGRESERHAGAAKKGGVLASPPGQKRSRGQQPGAPGHGRHRQPDLPSREEVIDLASARCPRCGQPFEPFGGEDSEVLEIDVRAYRRVIHRRRYLPRCHCGCQPGIVTAPVFPRLMIRGKYGVSVWAMVLLDKYLHGRPSHRLLQDLADLGLSMAAGTLVGGLRQLAPLFAPLDAAWRTQLLSEPHWHADETRWRVFAECEGKVGHRWVLWVFHSPSVAHYVLDPTRSARVIEGELGGATVGTISCDRHSSYKKFAREHSGIVLAFCWAHQWRDFLAVANAHPDLAAWAMAWVDEIAKLYGLWRQRGEALAHGADASPEQQALQEAVAQMAQRRETQRANPKLAGPAAAVLTSMQAHWPGLTVFVDHPAVPMDNNTAERNLRLPVVGRKNYYGSGAEWSGHLAAVMFGLLKTVELWGLNPRTWLTAYLQACAENGGKPPANLDAFVPWAWMSNDWRPCARGLTRNPWPAHRSSIPHETLLG